MPGPRALAVAVFFGLAAATCGRNARVRRPVPVALGGAAEAEPQRVAARTEGANGLRSAVVYGVVPPLFGTPPLRAVTKALPELADLGADVVWLSPIFESPEGDYGYAVTDYSRVRESYGTDDDLHHLVDEAHRLGMRVLLDFVPNHTSSRHPYFADAQARGRDSPYFAFYSRDAALRPTHYFDWQELPNLDYGNEQVRRWMVGETTSRVRDFVVDGFRMDAAWGVRQRAPRLWRRWIGEVRRIAPDAVFVAEASARDLSFVDEGFDAAYDWTEQVGVWAWQGMFDHPETISARVWADMNEAAGARTVRFLDNNDTGDRFVTRYGPGMTRVAAALLLTLPGVPCLFTGDELGAEYDPYRSREPLVGGSHPELRSWYRTLIALRHAHPSLSHGRMLPVRAEGAARVFAFARHDRESGEIALVVLNFDGHPARAVLTLRDPLVEKGGVSDLVGGRSIATTRGVLALDIGPWGVFIASVQAQ